MFRRSAQVAECETAMSAFGEATIDTRKGGGLSLSFQSSPLGVFKFARRLLTEGSSSCAQAKG